MMRLAAAFVAGICVGAGTLIAYLAALTLIDTEA